MGRSPAALTGLCAVALLSFWALPAPRFADRWSAVLLARDGAMLDAKLAEDGQWRFPPGPPLPQKLEAALLQQEDKRFYSHPGVDPLALLRAARLNLREGRVVSGGSTITMQTVRLARRNPPRRLGEKLVEAALAMRLEASASKQRILALYAAHAPFGENVVGVEAASWRFFGRAPRRLSWGESALLAVLPNSPALIHPGRNRPALKAKRDRLLRALHAAGKFDALELELALREPLPEKPRPYPHLAPHLLETLLAKRKAGPPRFETTLDASLQRAAQEIVSRRSALLAPRGIRNAAAVILDVRDGSPLAYVGNSRLDDYESSGYAVDVVQRPRSTGSLLKPFLYEAMLQAGELLPETLVADIPTQYDGFMPQNNDRRYRGAVRAKEALARSLNVPWVRLLREHGVGRFHGELKALGLSTLTRPPEDYGLTLILGGGEGTLSDLTAMYAALARRASGRRGAGAAWLTLEALVDVVRPGDEAAWRSFSSGTRLAWKTGTSVGFRDGWAIGVDGAHAVGVWTGNASGEGSAELTGTGAAAPILFELFRRLEAGAWFARPEWDLTRTAVCADDGRLPAGDCAVETVWAPAGVAFETASPHHRLVHLDSSARWRVHQGCESVSNMRHEGRFVLPPAQELYYKRLHAEYKPLPPWRPDCRGPETEGESPIAWVYPHAKTKVYIPTELDGTQGRTVFEAAHADASAELHWHLDGGYLGSTRTLHQRALDALPGRHTVTVVDDWGNQATRAFEVLGL
jgi:penicillin-binding protein 1C